MTIQTEAPDANALANSFAFCQALTKSRAKNFYYALRLLPRPKRSAMYALYAWMRLADDIADEEDGRSIQQRIDDLDALQRQTHDALLHPIFPSSNHPTTPLWPAFIDIVRRYSIPHELFDDMIAGQRQDLLPVRCAASTSFTSTATASPASSAWPASRSGATKAANPPGASPSTAASPSSSPISSATSARMPPAAASISPKIELSAHGVSADDLAAGRESPGFVDLMRFQIDRAHSYFRSSADLDCRIERDSRTALLAMTGIYRGLLKKIAPIPPACFAAACASRFFPSSSSPLPPGLATQGASSDEPAMMNAPFTIQRSAFPARVLVIGGGLAGMAAAVALESAGVNVTLVEAQPASGRPRQLIRRPRNRRADRQLPARAPWLLHQPHRLLPPAWRSRSHPLPSHHSFPRLRRPRNMTSGAWMTCPRRCISLSPWPRSAR